MNLVASRQLQPSVGHLLASALINDLFTDDIALLFIPWSTIPRINLQSTANPLMQGAHATNSPFSMPKHMCLDINLDLIFTLEKRSKVLASPLLQTVAASLNKEKDQQCLLASPDLDTRSHQRKTTASHTLIEPGTASS
eukprot:1154915-Pelagomonas_calceolata.AAC.2